VFKQHIDILESKDKIVIPAGTSAPEVPKVMQINLSQIKINRSFTIMRKNGKNRSPE
jgi:hypothetical protein